MTRLSPGYGYSRRALAAALVGCLMNGCGGRTEGDAAATIGEQEDQRALTGTATSPSRPRANDATPVVPDPMEPTRRTGEALAFGPSGSNADATIYVETSPLGTTLELVETSGRLCVRGELAPVPDGDYPNYWGGEVGLELVSNVREVAPTTEGLSVAGFAFRLEGLLPPILRFRVGAAGEVPLFSQYCQHVPLNTGTRIEVTLEELASECWNGGGLAFPDASRAALLSWQVPANESTVEAFDFCIEAIEALK